MFDCYWLKTVFKKINRGDPYDFFGKNFFFFSSRLQIIGNVEKLNNFIFLFKKKPWVMWITSKTPKQHFVFFHFVRLNKKLKFFNHIIKRIKERESNDSTLRGPLFQSRGAEKCKLLIAKRTCFEKKKTLSERDGSPVGDHRPFGIGKLKKKILTLLGQQGGPLWSQKIWPLQNSPEYVFRYGEYESVKKKISKKRSKTLPSEARTLSVCPSLTRLQDARMVIFSCGFLH